MQSLDTREKIIDAAIKLFAEKGYHATSVQEIMDLAGVNKAMFFYYFKNKESCYHMLFEKGLNKLGEKIAHALKARGDFKHKLKKFVESISDIPDDERHHMMAMIFIREAVSSKEIVENQVKGFIKVIEPLENALKEWQNQGLIRKTDPRLTVVSIIGGIKDLALHHKRLGYAHKEVLIQHTMDLILNGISIRPEEEK